MFGGDGWAYDIGYGGLDHVLAQGEDVNVLVLDTELYSNTGGQASKATPTGSVVEVRGSRQAHQEEGPRRHGHDVRLYLRGAGLYGREPQPVIESPDRRPKAYPGPSLVIAYAPCINHGINMSKTQAEDEACGGSGLLAAVPVQSGCSRRKARTPSRSTARSPRRAIQDFINSEIRYKTLAQQFPEDGRGAVQGGGAGSQGALRGYYKRMAESK